MLRYYCCAFAKFGVIVTKNFTKETVLSIDRNAWIWGFTSQSESWNGRLAMLGFASVILIEALSDQGVLHFWNLL
jgi:hypothetical protein